MFGFGATGQFAIGEGPVVTVAAAVTIEWYVPFSVPLKYPQRLQPSEQQFIALDPNPVISFGWFEPLTDPAVRVKQGLIPPNQQALTISTQPVVPFSWFDPFTDPTVRQRPYLPAREQIMLATSPQPFVPFSWFDPFTDPAIRTAARLWPSRQQFLAWPSRLLPTASIVGILNAIEIGDSALIAGILFGRPVSALVGVIELPIVQVVGVIENSAPSGIVGTIESGLNPLPGSPVAAAASALVSIREV